jgi:hypothetical protein
LLLTQFVFVPLHVSWVIARCAVLCLCVCEGSCLCVKPKQKQQQ